MSTPVIWISGASSGIGDALVRSVPMPDARVIGISRRPGAAKEHLAADLADPASWRTVAEHFAEVLGAGNVELAMFLHFAANNEPLGPVVDVDFDAYSASVLLNSAAPQILGKAFLDAVHTADVPGTLVMCSSPGARAPVVGMAHYGAGKLAMERWSAVVAKEEFDQVKVVVVRPYAVDTPMLHPKGPRPDPARMRQMLPNDPEDVAAAGLQALVEKIRDGGLASPESAAQEIWDAALGPVESGAVVAVGAPPDDLA